MFDCRRDISSIRRDISPVTPFSVLSSGLADEILERHGMPEGGFFYPGSTIVFREEGEAEEDGTGSVQTNVRREPPKVNINLELYLLLSDPALTPEEKKEILSAREKELRVLTHEEIRILGRAAALKNAQREKKASSPGIRQKVLSPYVPVTPSSSSFGKGSISQKKYPAMVFSEVIGKAQSAGVTFGGAKPGKIPVPVYITDYEEKHAVHDLWEEAVSESKESETAMPAERIVPAAAETEERTVVLPGAVSEERPAVVTEPISGKAAETGVVPGTVPDVLPGGFPGAEITHIKENTEAGEIPVSSPNKESILGKLVGNLSALFRRDSMQHSTLSEQDRPAAETEEPTAKTGLTEEKTVPDMLPGGFPGAEITHIRENTEAGETPVSSPNKENILGKLSGNLSTLFQRDSIVLPAENNHADHENAPFHAKEPVRKPESDGHTAAFGERSTVGEKDTVNRAGTETAFAEPAESTDSALETITDRTAKEGPVLLSERASLKDVAWESDPANGRVPVLPGTGEMSEALPGSFPGAELVHIKENTETGESPVSSSNAEKVLSRLTGNLISLFRRKSAAAPSGNQKRTPFRAKEPIGKPEASFHQSESGKNEIIEISVTADTAETVHTAHTANTADTTNTAGTANTAKAAGMAGTTAVTVMSKGAEVSVKEAGPLPSAASGERSTVGEEDAVNRAGTETAFAKPSESMDSAPETIPDSTAKKGPVILSGQASSEDVTWESEPANGKTPVPVLPGTGEMSEALPGSFPGAELVHIKENTETGESPVSLPKKENILGKLTGSLTELFRRDSTGNASEKAADRLPSEVSRPAGHMKPAAGQESGPVQTVTGHSKKDVQGPKTDAVPEAHAKGTEHVPQVPGRSTKDIPQATGQEPNAAQHAPGAGAHLSLFTPAGPTGNTAEGEYSVLREDGSFAGPEVLETERTELLSGKTPSENGTTVSQSVNESLSGIPGTEEFFEALPGSLPGAEIVYLSDSNGTGETADSPANPGKILEKLTGDLASVLQDDGVQRARTFETGIHSETAEAEPEHERAPEAADAKLSEPLSERSLVKSTEGTAGKFREGLLPGAEITYREESREPEPAQNESISMLAGALAKNLPNTAGMRFYRNEMAGRMYRQHTGRSTAFESRPMTENPWKPFSQELSENRTDREDTAPGILQGGITEPSGEPLYSPYGEFSISYADPMAGISREIRNAIESGAVRIPPRQNFVDPGNLDAGYDPFEMQEPFAEQAEPMGSSFVEDVRKELLSSGPMVTYENPYFMQMGAGMTYRDDRNRENRRNVQAAKTPEQQPYRISDAEIRRSADKIYGLIKDKIRLERRSMGL